MYLTGYTAPSGFSLPSPPGEIQTGQQVNIAVVFDPTSMASYSGTAYAYYSGNGTSYTFAMNVSGAGVDFLFVNPKYVIVGVEYAPPGTSSTVTYADNSVSGNTTSMLSSFSNQSMQTFSTSVSGGKIPGFKVTETATTSNSYTEGTSSSSSVAISQTIGSSTGLQGQTVALDHDWDYIFVWLNPIVRYTVGPTSTQVTWEGYGYDLNDTQAYPDMEVIGIPLGCLDGHFGWSSPHCENITPRLARTWAGKNVDGTGPGLTSADLANIEKADPFHTTYTLTFAPGSYTTTDGRFTACNNTGCSQTIDYEQGIHQTYYQGYSTTVTGSETASYIYSTTYSVESEFEAGAATVDFKADLKNSTTLTWTYEFTQATNHSNGQTATLSIVGPSSGYTGPPEFVVYQDNLYGTFMFYPVN